MEFCAYVLISKSLDRFYIGSTDNFEKRLFEYNTGFYENTFTSKVADWELFLFIPCLSRKQSTLVETHIKKMKSKKFIENLKQYPELVEKMKSRYGID